MEGKKKFVKPEMIVVVLKTTGILCNSQCPTDCGVTCRANCRCDSWYA